MTDEQIYEYAGFKFYVKDDGESVELKPVEGQHSAAYKQKHIWNALMMYKQEHPSRKKRK